MEGVRAALLTDIALQEFAKTPLILNVAIWAYRGRETNHLVEQGQMSSEQFRKQLFQAYVERVLEARGSGSAPYTQEQTIQWLVWLAGKMRKQGLSIFSIEGLQPYWLETELQLRQYGTNIRLLVGLFVGLGSGLVAGLVAGLVYGGSAVIQHIVLRRMLYPAGVSPLNYAAFLNYCVDRQMLRRVGGDYIFIHDYLLEYFAGLK